MGTGGCFGLIGLRKSKQDRSKQAKVHSTTDKSNGTNGSISPPNNGEDVPRIFVEERAAIRIQKAYRIYKARKSLRRIRGTGRFNVLIQGNNVQKQTSGALSCIHSWCYIQTQIRNRRLCMVTEGRIKQRKMENQLKLEAKIHELEVEWHNGSETMEEILSRIHQREEAAVKRERAMAYAFSHQWRANSSQYLGQAYYSICKENWGWSWMERWIAARPWEVRVNVKTINQKKIKTRQVSNADKLTNQASAESKVTSNGNKTSATTKAKKTLAVEASQETQQ